MTFLRFAKRFHAVFSSCFEAASRNRNGNNTIDSRPYPSKVEWRKIPPFKKIGLRALAVALLSNLTTTTKRVIWWCTNHSTLQDLRMKNNIKDKVVAITGASSGIGEAIARHLATEGAKVALGARRRGHLDKIVGEIVAAGGQALA